MLLMNLNGNYSLQIPKSPQNMALAKLSAKMKAALTLVPIAVGIDSNGLFDVCPPQKSSNILPSPCVSSQDDSPPVFLPPWQFDGNYVNIKSRLLVYVSSLKGAELIQDRDRYIRFRFTDINDKNVVDDMEFYFTPSDSIIQFRSCRRGNNVLTDFGVNRKRIEDIRIKLGLESIAVLRNRRRSFIFGESQFDSFGPTTIQFDKVIDKISGDMSDNKGVYGELDPLAPVFSAPSPYPSSSKK